MHLTDADDLLQPVSEDHPTGADLEYDPAFLAAVEAAQGVPERQMGASVVPAQEPDWSQAAKLAKDLLRRSKDLRIAVLLTRALLHSQGLPGINTGLELVNGLVARFWDDLYPRLDPAEGNDPTARINILLDLCDRETLLGPLRVTLLARSRVFGPVTYRDIEVAEGRTSPRTGTPPDAAAIAGAFQDCDLEELTLNYAAAAGSLEQVRNLNDTLLSLLGPQQAPNFEPLMGLLSAIGRALHVQLAARQPAEMHTPPSAGDGVDDGAVVRPTKPSHTPSQIDSRDDVVLTLDRLCDYYLRNEPSSPVPLLLQRARRLATGSFVDIVRDLAPDALPQIEKVCGIETPKR
jgi:type VI secretion system protein ImpA